MVSRQKSAVVTSLQVITYKEWLPKVIGADGMAMIGPYTGYDPSVEPSIFNELATAAFRFGHGLIRPIIERLKEDLTPIPEGNLPLHQGFFAPHRVVDEGRSQANLWY
jgi:peroxidase